MKNLKTLCVVVALLCFVTKTSAQSDRINSMATEVLVFIKPDYLESTPALRRGISVQQSSIKSDQLKTAFETLRVNTIARAFPDWPKISAVSFNDMGEQVKRPEFHRVFILTFSSEEEAEEAVKSLNKLPEILYAERHSMPTLNNDPQYLDGTQWHLRNDGRNWGVVGADINAEGAWSIFRGSSNVTIGIFDTGVELDHDEFRGRVTGDRPSGASTHGTLVAGMAIARANNGVLGRGLDWNAAGRSFRLSDWDFCPIERRHRDIFKRDNVIANTIIDAVDQGVHVLNHSWGSPTFSTTIRQAFAYAYRMNRVSVAAMGNCGNVQSNFPAAFGNVIAVGSTNNRDVRWSLSTMGSHIDVVAPGESVFTTTTGNRYTFASGTSLSAPLVSGLASLLRGYRPQLYNDDIKQIIRRSADRTPGMGGQNFTPAYGFGRINAGRALEMIRDYDIRQWTAIGGVDQGNDGRLRPYVFFGVPGLSSNEVLAYRHQVRRTIYFPEPFLEIIGIWGRGVATTGWAGTGNVKFNEGFCEVVSYTLNSVTLKTYVYEVFTLNRRIRIGWFPTSPANVRFAYTVLGTVAPSLTGPTILCPGNTANLTIQNLPAGATVRWVHGPGLEIEGSNNQPTARIRSTGRWDLVVLPLETEAIEILDPPGNVIPRPTLEPPTTSWVRATISLNGQVIRTLDHNLTVNRVNLGSIQPLVAPSGGFQVNVMYRFTSEHEHPGRLTWVVNPSNQSFANVLNRTQAYIRFMTAGAHTITASVTNMCGASSTQRVIQVMSSGCFCGHIPPGGPRPCPRCEFSTTPVDPNPPIVVNPGNPINPPGPPIIVCPGPPIDFSPCPCGHIPPGGPRPCPRCELNTRPIESLFSPNPVSDILTIDLTQTDIDAFGIQPFSETETIFDIRLLNSHGMVVRQQRTQAATIQFDVSNLPEGTYYLHIEHGGEIEMHQIIVQRN